MTNNLQAAPAPKETGDEEFFSQAIEFRNLQDEVEELEAELNRLMARRNNLNFGELIPLGRMEEIIRLSNLIDEKRESMKIKVENLVSKFYPSQSSVRQGLKGVWIGVKPNTAIRFSDDFQSIEIKDLH